MHIMWYTGHAIGMLHSYDENLNFSPARKGVEHCHTHITHLTCQMHHWISDSITERFFFITKRFSGNCILHLPWIVSYNPYVHFVHVNEPPTSTWSKVVHFILIFFFSLIVNWNVKNSRKSFWKRYKLNQFLINLNPVCCSLKLNKVDAMLKCKIQREKRNKPEIN